MNTGSQWRTNETDEDSEYYVETCSLASTISTNATADDLPGLGRTLGLFYSFAGKHLELQLGRLAEKLGKGPRMTAIRIERRRSKAIGLPAGSRKVAAQNAKIEKDCRNLVKYVRSDIASTKLQALDQITRLAIEDEFVRDVLLVKGAVHVIEPLQQWNSTWADFPTLMTSSRRALFSLADTEVNVIGHEISASLPTSDPDVHLQPLNCIKLFLSDPDRAFLVIRHLERLFGRIHARCAGCAINLLDFIASPEEFSASHLEWDTLDKLILQYTSVVLSPNADWQALSGRVLAPLMELLLRFPEKLPKMIDSDFFSWFATYDPMENGITIRHIYLTNRLLEGVALANSLHGDGSFEIDTVLLQALYPHPAVQPLISRLTCPPEILLRQIIALRYQTRGKVYLDAGRSQEALEFGELEHLCGQLSQYVDSDDMQICQRALRVFKYLLSTDIYCRRTSLRALSATRFARTSSYELLVEESGNQCIPMAAGGLYTRVVTRHCTDNGHLLHIREDYRDCCDGIEGIKQAGGFSAQDMLKLRIPRGTSFSAAGHHPLLAGITAAGEKAYVAVPISKDGLPGNYVAITEGTKPEDLRTWVYHRHARKERKMVPLYLIVYVLRYTPGAYLQCERFANDEVGLDATGPFSWKPWTPNVFPQAEPRITGWSGDDDVGQVPTAGSTESNGLSPFEDNDVNVVEEDSGSTPNEQHCR